MTLLLWKLQLFKLLEHKLLFELKIYPLLCKLKACPSIGHNQILAWHFFFKTFEKKNTTPNQKDTFFLQFWKNLQISSQNLTLNCQQKNAKKKILFLAQFIKYSTTQHYHICIYIIQYSLSMNFMRNKCIFHCVKINRKTGMLP